MRKKIKTFLHILTNSFFPLEYYYKKILKARFLFSLKYFFTLILVLNFILLSSLVFKNLIFNNSLAQFKASLMKSLDDYPENLIITIKNNHLTSNFDRPYIFWLSFQNVPHPILVIDERAPKEKVYQFDSTTILINSDGIVRRVGTGLRFYQFKIKNDLTVDKQAIENLKNLILRFFKLFLFFISFILILLFILLVIFFSLTKIFYLAIFSFFGFWIAKIFNIKTNYKKVFQISIHSNTMPLICEFSLLILFCRAKFFIWYLLLTLVFFTTAIYETYFHQIPLKTSHKPHHKKTRHHPTDHTRRV